MKKNLSKFLSLLLRHKPESIGLELDQNGWAKVADLTSLAPEFNLENLKEIVRDCEKQRYCLDLENMKIRANQGHSIKIDLELEEQIPPEFLYHGTTTKYLDSIFKNGLSKQNRNHVHLSENKETALKVGKRHGNPVVLLIKSGKMNVKFYKSLNNVWLTDFISPEFIEITNAN